MYGNSDNIVALATLAGKSALNVVRVSGPLCKKFFQQLTHTAASPKPNHVYPKYIYSGPKKKPFDFASLVYYRAPKSFTGEESLEVSVHGGVLIANKLVETLVSFGARQALPGEFSYRAFHNNKIDLLQAESIAAIAEANNNIDSYYLLNNIKGALSKNLNIIKKDVVDLIALGEHEVDFTEHEMSLEGYNAFNNRLCDAKNKIDNILKGSYVSTQENSGIRVVIVGLPNVGKSSIFNHIVGQSRSIVTNEKGTTRDTVEKEIYIGTTLITLIDTAGIRTTESRAESAGIKKTYQEITSANIIIIADDTNPEKIYNLLTPHIKSQKVLLVLNKTDLIKNLKKTKRVYNLSCKKNLGFNLFLTKLLTLCKQEIDFFNNQYLYLLNKRQKSFLQKIKKSFVLANKEYKKSQDLSVLLSCLYLIRDQFDSLMRPGDKEEILRSIFKGFCVGK